MTTVGREAGRIAVAAFFRSQVAGLNTVYDGEPRNARQQDYFANQDPKPLTGAVGWPYIEASHSRRIAWQKKERIYEFAFSLRVFSFQSKGEDAYNDHDSMIDAFIVRLESDRTLGGAFFQGGEGDTSLGEDIYVVTGPGPKQRTTDGPIVIWSMVRFKAIEMV